MTIWIHKMGGSLLGCFENQARCYNIRIAADSFSIMWCRAVAQQLNMGTEAARHKCYDFDLDCRYVIQPFLFFSSI